MSCGVNVGLGVAGVICGRSSKLVPIARLQVPWAKQAAFGAACWGLVHHRVGGFGAVGGGQFVANHQPVAAR
jgi:hypothetical protein